MESENWRWQVSYKVGPHMVNVRANSRAEMIEELRWISDNAAEFRAHVLALDLPSPPEATVQKPIPTPSPEPVRPSPANVAQKPEDQGPENGPAVVLKVTVNEGVNENTGKGWTRYAANIGGVNVSTFDTVLGAALRNLTGKSCFFRATQSPKYPKQYDLHTIRAA